MQEPIFYSSLELVIVQSKGRHSWSNVSWIIIISDVKTANEVSELLIRFYQNNTSHQADYNSNVTQGI